jgi:hypothetical protein
MLSQFYYLSKTVLVKYMISSWYIAREIGYEIT